MPFTGFVLFLALQIPGLSMTFSTFLSTFYKFLKLLCFRVFLTLSSLTDTNSGVHLKDCAIIIRRGGGGG